MLTALSKKAAILKVSFEPIQGKTPTVRLGYLEVFVSFANRAMFLFTTGISLSMITTFQDLLAFHDSQSCKCSPSCTRPPDQCGHTDGRCCCAESLATISTPALGAMHAEASVEKVGGARTFPPCASISPVNLGQADFGSSSCSDVLVRVGALGCSPRTSLADVEILS